MLSVIFIIREFDNLFSIQIYFFSLVQIKFNDMEIIGLEQECLLITG